MRKTRTLARILVLVIVAAAIIFFAPKNPTQAPSPLPVAVPFHPESIWNKPIPPNAVVHPNSAQMIALLTEATKGEINIDGIDGAWSVPVYYADASTPVQLVCDAGRTAPCEMVPIPHDMIPSPDADAKTVIIDTANRPPRAWSFWALQKGDGSNGDWAVNWGAFGWTDISAEGDGLRHHQGGEWGGRVTGWNYFSGLIHPEEIIQGRIDHALAFFIPQQVAALDKHVWPAKSTDGLSTDPYALTLGSRIQLDPAVDVNALDLSDGAKVVARALQVYGGWLADTGVMAAVDAREFVSVDEAGQPYVNSAPWYGLLTHRDLYSFPMHHLRILQTDEADFYVHR
jgi:hypothetical protein